MRREIEKIRLHINCQKGRSVTLADYEIVEKEGSVTYIFTPAEGISASFEITRFGPGIAGRLKLELENESCRESWNLELERPVVLEAAFSERPLAVTAMYMFNEWWTRPSFVNTPGEVPAGTQVLYLKYNGGAGCMAGMAGENFKTLIEGGEGGELCFVMTACAGGIQKLDELVFVSTRGECLYEAVHAAFVWAAGKKHIRVRAKRRYPEMFEYLGWCSWDAFYTDITEQKVREKAAELKEKGVPVRWMLMDDGWLSVHDQLLYDYRPEPEKFPRGFSQMIREIKRDTDIRWFGVWHALGGYWGGVEAGSPLACQENEHLYRPLNGKLLPWPDAGKGYGFYRDWYEYLRGEGIDFAKVDGQSAVRFYYENDMPVCRAAGETHKALDGAAAYLDGALINCMGMAMENMLARPVSAVARNSDDFVPGREGGFAEHLLQNAYNALYQGEIYNCDWDMFWTTHEDAVKHSLLRAQSGGPVYFSDRIRETDPEILKPLVYSDGRLLRLKRPAIPAEECLFRDPQREGILKLTNYGDYGESKTAGGIALYNLTGNARRCRLSPGDIPELRGETDCWVYDYFARRAFGCAVGEEVPAELAGDGYGWYWVLPRGGAGTVAGLLDKYNGFLAVESLCQEERQLTAVVREGGILGIFCEEDIAGLWCNGQEITELIERGKNLCLVDLSGRKGRLVIHARW